eukprot:scaffold115465_cov15-Cyclotella_meneghiniana.AAC.1
MVFVAFFFTFHVPRATGEAKSVWVADDDYALVAAAAAAAAAAATAWLFVAGWQGGRASEACGPSSWFTVHGFSAAAFTRVL